MIDLTPIRAWLATLNPGTPWIALVAALALLLRLSLHWRVAPYVVTILGPKYREVVGLVLVTFGGLFPQLTSTSQTPEADSALGALAALVVAMVGLWIPPKPPAEDAK